MRSRLARASSLLASAVHLVADALANRRALLKTVVVAAGIQRRSHEENRLRTDQEIGRTRGVKRRAPFPARNSGDVEDELCALAEPPSWRDCAVHAARQQKPEKQAPQPRKQLHFRSNFGQNVMKKPCSASLVRRLAGSNVSCLDVRRTSTRARKRRRRKALPVRALAGQRIAPAQSG